MEVKIPILNNEYSVVVCNGTLKELSKTLKSYQYPEYSLKMVTEVAKNKRGLTFYGHRCTPVIWIDSSRKKEDQIGTLAHEATHAINEIWKVLNETSYDEVFAHSIGAVVRETLKAWKGKQDLW